MTPEVTVVLPVRNGARWVADAVRSVFRQTLDGVHLVAVDDGSTDDSVAVLTREARSAHLMTVIVLPGPHGLAFALNRGIALAGRAPLIARLDADDWMQPTRLERQVTWLRAHPETVLLGTGVAEVDERGRTLRHRWYPMRDREIRRALPKRNPFAHASVVFRRDAFERAGGYDATYPVAQDYDLWVRLARQGALFNFPSALTVRRIHPGAVSARRAKMRRLMEARVRWALLKRGEWRAAWPALRALAGAAVA